MKRVELRALVRISACVGLRDEQQLEREFRDALRKRVPPRMIREAILQSYLFAGYAAAINAFILFNQLSPGAEFFQEKGGSMAEWKRRGARLCKQIYGMQYGKLVANMKTLHPDLAEWMLWEGYGKVLSRPFLAPRIRELLIVATTAVLNVERQFHSHVRGALHVGATAKELRETLQQVEVWMKAGNVRKFRQKMEQIIAEKK